MGPQVVVEDLTRVFGARTVVAGVDFEVGEGEIFAVLGPNGAGKSTLIRMLTTLLKPTSGRALIAGIDVASRPREVRKVIGGVLQETSVDQLMTGVELMRLQAALHGLGKAEARRRTGELLSRFGLDGVAGDRVSTYSGGTRRRLDLALSLLHRPKVLFLDEPTTGIDPTSRLAVWDEIRALRDEGTTVMLTTQYLEEADRLCRDVAILVQGRIARSGAVDRLKAEVDAPTLVVGVEERVRARTAEILAGFGPARARSDDEIAIALPGGTAETAAVVRALDEAAITVDRLQVEPPSLDDVFAEATGGRLEGALTAESGT
ncbi:ABC transporter ATP-binding protein [Actinocorallia sp. B10E7]|uniref:ABC transporter ATP-binding protein n=1 Tax=Actinocorallia sp. B10E7 TaxID=3153558 RepID=UPI00325F338E